MAYEIKTYAQRVTFEDIDNAKCLKEVLDTISSKGLFYCKKCRKMLNISWNSERIDNHFWKYHSKIPRLPLACPMRGCRMEFALNDREKLLDHAWLEHFGSGLKIVNTHNLKEYLKDPRYIQFLVTAVKRITKLDHFFCKACDTFKLMSNLQMHYLNIHQIEAPEEPLQCPVVNCFSKFAEKEKFAIHVKVRHLRHILKCFTCGQLFLKKEDLAKHRCTFQIPMPTESLFYIPESKELIREYLEKNKMKKFKCNACKYVIKTKDLDLHDHCPIHIDLLIPCPIDKCDATFKMMTINDMHQHLLDNHILSDENEISNLVCPIQNCRLTFNSSQELLYNDHVKRHGPKPGLILLNIPFNKETTRCLKLYFKKQGNTLFKCKFCKNLQIHFRSMSMHLNNFHVLPNFTIECPIPKCSSTFTRNEYHMLGVHIKRVNLGLHQNKGDAQYDGTNIKEVISETGIRKSITSTSLVNNQDRLGRDLVKGKPNQITFTPEVIECLKIYIIRCNKTNNRSYEYTCKYCNTSVSFQDIYTHLNVYHKNIDSTILCPISDKNCDVTFTREDYDKIALHIKNVHLNFKKISHSETKPTVVENEAIIETEDSSCNSEIIHIVEEEPKESERIDLAGVEEEPIVEFRDDAVSYTLEVETTEFCQKDKQQTAATKSDKNVQILDSGDERTKQFMNRVSLMHRRQHVLICKMCGKKDNSIECYLFHLHKSHGITDQYLICLAENCDEKFGIDERTLLVDHMREVHLGYNRKCSICNKAFAKRDAMESHEILEHGVKRDVKGSKNKRRKNELTAPIIREEVSSVALNNIQKQTAAESSKNVSKIT